MKRKIIEKLIKWKEESAGETALVIDGARRVGKSYIVREFAKKYYKSCIIIDFNEAEKEVFDLFDNYIRDLDTFFMYLSNYYGVTLYEHETLIVLDEIQLCKRARAAIKFLVADGRYHYIETGSLLSIHENIKGIVVPSEERHIKMYPMDFEEFVWAMDEENIINVIRDSFESKRQMGTVCHRKAMNLFRQYLIVGGMPQAVANYCKYKDFNKVDAIKRDILQLYRFDVKKFGKRYEEKVESIFDEIPDQLTKHEKKFQLSSLGRGSAYRDYESAFNWLVDSMIVNACYNSTSPEVGIKLNRDRTTLKLYMADTGLLISHSFDEDAIEKEELYKRLLFERLELNEGMFFENIVAQMMVASGHKLYFYSNSSRTHAEDRMEIDFIISKKNISRIHNVSPIEVKSGQRYTTNSLNKFIKKFNKQLDTPYIIHTLDLMIKDDKIYLPVYMTWLI